MHILLVITILCTFVVIVGEICRPNNFLLAAARPMLTVMQGIWLIQVAHILYRGEHRTGFGMKLGLALFICITGHAYSLDKARKRGGSKAVCRCLVLTHHHAQHVVHPCSQ